MSESHNKISEVTLAFWVIKIAATTLGETGGLALSRPLASAILTIFILGCLLVLPQRAGPHRGKAGLLRK